MMVSGLCCALGGGLYAHYIGYLSPGPFDVGFSVKLLLMVAIGGFADVWGVLFGVIFITLIGEAPEAAWRLRCRRLRRAAGDLRGLSAPSACCSGVSALAGAGLRIVERGARGMNEPLLSDRWRFRQFRCFQGAVRCQFQRRGR